MSHTKNEARILKNYYRYTKRMLLIMNQFSGILEHINYRIIILICVRIKVKKLLENLDWILI